MAGAQLDPSVTAAVYFSGKRTLALLEHQDWIRMDEERLIQTITKPSPAKHGSSF